MFNSVLDILEQRKGGAKGGKKLNVKKSRKIKKEPKRMKPFAKRVKRHKYISYSPETRKLVVRVYFGGRLGTFGTHAGAWFLRILRFVISSLLFVSLHITSLGRLSSSHQSAAAMQESRGTGSEG